MSTLPSSIGFHSMTSRYVLLRPLGDGGFGEVWLALPLPKSYKQLPSIPAKSLVRYNWTEVNNIAFLGVNMDCCRLLLRVSRQRCKALNRTPTFVRWSSYLEFLLTRTWYGLMRSLLTTQCFSVILSWRPWI